MSAVVIPFSARGRPTADAARTQAERINDTLDALPALFIARRRRRAQPQFQGYDPEVAAKILEVHELLCGKGRAGA